MAIGAIGAVAYANQAMPAQTKMQSNFQNRLDMQNSVATAIQDADKQEIIEVRPAEETHKIDPDNEHEKEKNKEEQSEKREEQNKKRQTKKQEETTVYSSTHLDIKA